MTTKVGLIDVPYVLVDKTQTCKNAKLTQQSTGFHVAQNCAYPRSPLSAVRPFLPSRGGHTLFVIFRCRCRSATIQSITNPRGLKLWGNRDTEIFTS